MVTSTLIPLILTQSERKPCRPRSPRWSPRHSRPPSRGTSSSSLGRTALQDPATMPVFNSTPKKYLLLLFIGDEEVLSGVRVRLPCPSPLHMARHLSPEFLTGNSDCAEATSTIDNQIIMAWLANSKDKHITPDDDATYGLGRCWRREVGERRLCFSNLSTSALPTGCPASCLVATFTPTANQDSQNSITSRPAGMNPTLL